MAGCATERSQGCTEASPRASWARPLGRTAHPHKAPVERKGKMGITVHKSGIESSSEDVERYRLEFLAKGYVRIPRFFETRFSKFVLGFIARAHWDPVVPDSFYSHESLALGPAFGLLHFVANWPGVLDVVGGIAGCGPLTWFDGWVYRMSPRCGHHDEWHTDFSDGRLVGMSVNLSSEPYLGGRFQLRRRGSTALLADVSNSVLGDALIFRISDDLVHRVTDVEGTQDKMSFAGWFHGVGPSFAERLQALGGATTTLATEKR